MIPIEDVYVTGILATINGVTQHGSDNFAFTSTVAVGPEKFGGTLTTTNVSPEYMYELWQSLQNM